MSQLTGVDECAKNGAHAPLRSTVIAIVTSIVTSIVASIASAIVNPLVGIVLTIVLTIVPTVLQLRQSNLRFVLVFIFVTNFLELSIDNIIVTFGGGVSTGTTAVTAGLRIVAFGIRLRIHLLGEFMADGG